MRHRRRKARCTAKGIAILSPTSRFCRSRKGVRIYTTWFKSDKAFDGPLKKI